MLKLKKLIKYTIYYFVSIFTFSKKSTEQKTLIILRLDAIGDYVLFRNFISILKESQEYKDYRITLVGNSVWKDIALELDNAFVDKFIWIDRFRLDSSFIYLYQKLKELTSSKYDVLINPTYSREFFYSDSLVKIISAKEKIGSVGDLSLMNIMQKQLGDKYYTQLIDTSSDVCFEFNRNKDFFEKLLKQSLLIKQPKIELEAKKINIDLPKEYIVLFIGANDSFRKWDIEKFVSIALYLTAHYDHEIVLCGGPNDREDALKFQKLYKGNVFNLVGKTTLVELLYVLQSAKFMISNETSAPHFALALDIEHLLVISNGNHYGRFTPYPNNTANGSRVIYPFQIENNIDDYDYLCSEYGAGSTLDINQVTTRHVIDKINEILK